MKQYFEITNKEEFDKFWIETAIPLRDKVRIRGVLTPHIIEIKPLKKEKTYLQLKGFHLLCNMLIPYFRDWTGSYWDLTKVKDFIKQRCGYTETFQDIVLVKSCRDATLEDMKMLITECEKFGAEMDIEGIKLEDEFLRELDEYFSNKKTR